MATLELWGGLECTINRIHDDYFDQCKMSGHDKRLKDLGMFADLGITKLRYPFLWERCAGANEHSYDWQWADQRASELKRLKIAPIAGLLHHGSGPKFTQLLDSDFAEKFAGFAKAFAERFPWIEDYTLINEPLTTARFSGLYGVWYPHQKNDQAFVRILLNQVKASLRGMEEIRKINPRARLIQTEDLGRASGTQKMQYQVSFENHRRWLSMDLLCGKVSSDHPLYDYLVTHGASSTELGWIQARACAPDIFGLNHYPLSSRFLDDNMELYPPCFHGGNGTDRYADLGVTDVQPSKRPSMFSLILEAWQRFQIPIALTEVQVAGARESQLSWLIEASEAAQSAITQGIPVKAITSWALLGSFEWNSLCTRCENYYESGAYDLRAEIPRPTAVAKFLKSFTQETEVSHPVLSDRPILITGGQGSLAVAFAQACGQRGLSVKLCSRKDLDITNASAVLSALQCYKPWALINTAGFVQVDQAEGQPYKCFRENLHGPVVLAEACAQSDVRFVTFSSDMVFNGKSQTPYLEGDYVDPLNVYGRSKAQCEQSVLECNSDSLVVRTSSFFGPWDQKNFLTRVMSSLKQGKSTQTISDVYMSPTYLPDLAHACLDLLIDGEQGVLHLANQGVLSWTEFALRALELAEKRSLLSARVKDLIIPVSIKDLGLAASRPLYSALNSTRAKIMPHIEQAMDRYFFDGSGKLLS